MSIKVISEWHAVVRGVVVAPERSSPDRPSPARRRLVLAVVMAAGGAVAITPPATRASGRASPALLLTASQALGQLALLLRLYAQIGQGVGADPVPARLGAVRDDTARSIARLHGLAGKLLPADDLSRLEQRWRTVREASFTRPSLDIAELMQSVADDMASQLRHIIQPDGSPKGPRDNEFERVWQQQVIHSVAQVGLFGCWQGRLAQPDRTRTLVADFDGWLREREKTMNKVTWVQFNSQWNLLTTSLPRADLSCTSAGVSTIAATADRLVDMVDADSRR